MWISPSWITLLARSLHPQIRENGALSFPTATYLIYHLIYYSTSSRPVLSSKRRRENDAPPFPSIHIRRVSCSSPAVFYLSCRIFLPRPSLTMFLTWRSFMVPLGCLVKYRRLFVSYVPFVVHRCWILLAPRIEYKSGTSTVHSHQHEHPLVPWYVARHESRPVRSISPFYVPDETDIKWRIKFFTSHPFSNHCSPFMYIQ